jgi:hypothetical protein
LGDQILILLYYTFICGTEDRTQELEFY